MGCDIHMYYEVKRENAWEVVEWDAKYRVGEYDDGSSKFDYEALFDDPLYIWRNYNLFSILANVRNGYGFAGIPTSTGFVPIDMPRGLPGDVSEEIAADSNGWGVDGHSHSWLTLREVLDYDWDSQSVILTGIVGEEEYKEFKENGFPSTWCGRISGRNIEVVPVEKMDDVIAGSRDSKKEYYTRIIWQRSYREAVGEKWFKTLNALQEIDESENVRLVFWFDN